MSKNFIYFGTPYVGRDTLAYLVEHGYVPSLVVTPPDTARGRGMELQPCETKAWALEHGLEVFTPEKLDTEAISRIQSYGCEYAIVVAYGYIIPKVLIESFPLGVLNVHYSLLPKYRGASPVEGALLAGETTTGVTVQRMVYELDAGDILAQQEVAILPTETTKDLRPRLVMLGAELLVSALPSFEEGSATFVAQDHTHATHSGRIEKKEGELSLSGDPMTNWNKYRAYAESPGTYFFTEKNGKQIRVKIKEAQLSNGAFIPTKVIPEGKKEMSYADFTR